MSIRVSFTAISISSDATASSLVPDAGKRISGIKRHIAVDTQGLPHAVAVSTAEVTDRLGALQAFQRCKSSLGLVQSALADGGYVGGPFAQGVREALGEHVTVQIAKRSELHTFAVIPQALVGRAQLCIAGEEQTAVEKLRALAQHQLAVHSLGLSSLCCIEDREHVLSPTKAEWLPPTLVYGFGGSNHTAYSG